MKWNTVYPNGEEVDVVTSYNAKAMSSKEQTCSYWSGIGTMTNYSADLPLPN